MVMYNDEFKFLTVLDNNFNEVEKTDHYSYMNDKNVLKFFLNFSVKRYLFRFTFQFFNHPFI